MSKACPAKPMSRPKRIRKPDGSRARSRSSPGRGVGHGRAGDAGHDPQHRSPASIDSRRPPSRRPSRWRADHQRGAGYRLHHAVREDLRSALPADKASSTGSTGSPIATRSLHRRRRALMNWKCPRAHTSPDPPEMDASLPCLHGLYRSSGSRDSVVLRTTRPRSSPRLLEWLRAGASIKLTGSWGQAASDRGRHPKMIQDLQRLSSRARMRWTRFSPPPPPRRKVAAMRSFSPHQGIGVIPADIAPLRNVGYQPASLGCGFDRQGSIPPFTGPFDPRSRRRLLGPRVCPVARFDNQPASSRGDRRIPPATSRPKCQDHQVHKGEIMSGRNPKARWVLPVSDAAGPYRLRSLGFLLQLSIFLVLEEPQTTHAIRAASTSSRSVDR